MQDFLLAQQEGEKNIRAGLFLNHHAILHLSKVFMYLLMFAMQVNPNNA